MQKLFDIPTDRDELLREILIELKGRAHPTGGISKMVEIAQDKEKRDLDIVFFTYPYTGATTTLSAGVTELNFQSGTIKDTSGTVTDMQHSLHSEGKDFLRSLYVNTDKAVKLQMDDGDKIFVGEEKDFQGTYFQFKKVRITTTEDTQVFVLACTNPEAILTLVDKASQVSGGSRLVRGDVVVESANAAGSTFITDEVLGTDDPTRYLTLYPATIQKFRLNSIRFKIKPTASETYRLYLLEDNTDPALGGAGLFDVLQASQVVYDSGAGMVSNTHYTEIGGGILPIEINLADTGKLYWMLDWTGAPGNTEGFIVIRGEKMT